MASYTWVHRLTNVDLEGKRADCKACGPNVPIRTRVRNGKLRRGCYSVQRRLGLEAERLPPKPDACPICLQSDAVMVPDHDHGTMRFRGWLCARCNSGLGFLGDDLSRLERAADYMRKAPTPEG